MKHILIYSLSLCVLNACNPAGQTGDKAAKHVRDLKELFKYRNLQAFSMDSLQWGKRSGYYTELDSNWFDLVWKGSGKSYNSAGYDRNFLYSWQERDKGTTEFVILTELEEHHGPELVYLIFDAKGNPVDQFGLAADCTDGGWFFESYGRFIKPGVYEHTCIEQTFTGMDSTDQKEIYKGDTTVYHYMIGNDGHVGKQQVYKREFSYTE